jgi:hypothetical protein
MELKWRKSSFSGDGNANCVEWAFDAAGDCNVRNSKDPDGPVVKFTPDEIAAFVKGVLNGEMTPDA